MWQDEATAAVVGALRDGAWRVREMAARVVARHRLDAALEEVAALHDDAVPRVRRAAERALLRLVTQERAEDGPARRHPDDS